MLTEELRERINKLSHVKRQLLNQQLRDHRAANIAPSRILPVAAASAAAFSLSHTQQMIWRTQAAYPAATFYNFPQVLRLDGALDTAALASALRYLVARHDVLRTRLVLAGGEPYALIAPATTAGTSAGASANISELRGHELPRASASSPILDDLLHQHIQRPFNLAEDLPLSAWLVQLAPARHILALVHHFAAFDYWSLALFNRELGHCYDAYAADRTPSLPPLPFAYADYAAWQRSSANEDRLAGSSYYWRWQLAKRTRAAGSDDRFRPAVKKFTADSFEFCLPSAMLGRLETLAQHENATLFMLLLASLQTLLARYTERNEIAVGTIVANRPSLETESLIGNFSNRLLLWGNLSGNPSFRQLLRRVRGATLDAYTRQDVPLDRMAADLYGAGFHPSYLFPVMFDYINEPLAPPNLNGLTVTRLPIQCSEIEYPLHVTAQRSPDHLRVRLQVRPDFEVRTTVPHMAYHWNTLLSAIADDPDQRIDSLPLTKHQPSRIIAEGWLATANPLSNSQAARL
jgi:hypothetical protein